MCFIIGLLALTQSPTPSSPTLVMFLDKYPQLQTGMTENQITELLGHPPGHYTSESHPGYIFRGGVDGPPRKRKTWYGEDCAVLVWFDSGGRATTIHQLLPVLLD